jgi:hypothetical protein
MALKWPGGLITKTKVTPAGPTEGGAASGIWTITEALQWVGKELWPTAGNVFQPVIFIGGYSNGTGREEIDEVNPATTGNATKWTDLTTEAANGSGCGSATRALWTPISGDNDMIQYIDYASGGGGSDFGAAVQADTVGSGALSTTTRGCFAAGDDSSARDVISYVTLSSVGAASDFGDLTIARYYITGMASATRGLWAGGEHSGSPTTRVDYITVASTGNAIDFGGVDPSSYWGAGSANGTYGMYWGGKTSSTDYTDKIQRVTIATLGDFVDFGDLTTGTRAAAGQGSSTRALCGGGGTSSDARTFTIEFVEIATTGNASDFGDLTQDRSNLMAASAVQGNF